MYMQEEEARSGSTSDAGTSENQAPLTGPSPVIVEALAIQRCIDLHAFRADTACLACKSWGKYVAQILESVGVRGPGQVQRLRSELEICERTSQGNANAHMEAERRYREFRAKIERVETALQTPDGEREWHNQGRSGFTPVVDVSTIRLALRGES